MIRTQCAFCGAKHDRISIMLGIGDEPEPPEPGDATMCVSCGQMNIFGDDLRLIAPTPEQQAMMDVDEKVQALRKAWRGARGLQ